jgi:hypothetical protein
MVSDDVLISCAFSKSRAAAIVFRSVVSSGAALIQVAPQKRVVIVFVRR